MVVVSITRFVNVCIDDNVGMPMTMLNQRPPLVTTSTSLKLIDHYPKINVSMNKQGRSKNNSITLLPVTPP